MMAEATVCQTSGAVFSTVISSRVVSCSVSLPMDLVLTEEEAEILDANMHNAMELVLGRYFQQSGGEI